MVTLGNVPFDAEFKRLFFGFFRSLNNLKMAFYFIVLWFQLWSMPLRVVPDDVDLLDPQIEYEWSAQSERLRLGIASGIGLSGG